MYYLTHEEMYRNIWECSKLSFCYWFLFDAVIEWEYTLYYLYAFTFVKVWFLALHIVCISKCLIYSGRMYILLLLDGVFYRCVFSCFNVVQIFDLLIFCQAFLPVIENGLLKFPTVIVEWSISLFNSKSSYFMYFCC